MLLIHALIGLSLLLSATSAEQYKCFPHPEKNMCLIDYIVYNPTKPNTFPTGYDYYRVTLMSVEKNMRSHVDIFDEDLYEKMHRPTRIEMAGIMMEQLFLPPELHVGNFSHNSLYTVTVDATRNYQIIDLDLDSNHLREITFVSSLVNLEILNLRNNRISTIRDSALAPLTKLKYLYLQHNQFTSIPWTDLPQTLIHLDCSLNYFMTSARFINVSLPSLEYLSLKFNQLPTINVTELLLAAPCLKEAHLINGHMTEYERDQIESTLTSNNVSFVEWPKLFRSTWPEEWPECAEEYRTEDGSCVMLEPVLGNRILLSGVVFGMAALLVYIVMNRKRMRHNWNQCCTVMST